MIDGIGEMYNALSILLVFVILIMERYIDNYNDNLSVRVARGGLSTVF